MPTPYIKKLAKQGKGTISELEKKWKKADKLATENGDGHKNDYAYRMKIFKNLVHAHSIVANTDVASRTAWHGSPHRGIAEFSLQRIGTGEGNQTYGYGLYFTDSKEIAEDYRKNLTKQDATQPVRRFFKGRELQPGTGEYLAARLLESSTLIKARRDLSAWIKEAAGWSEKRKADPGEQRLLESWKDALALLTQAVSKKDFSIKPAQGQLYEVEIPEDDVMLWWDAPLSQQPEGVRGLLKKLPSEVTKSELRGMPAKELEPTGMDIYSRISRSHAGSKSAGDKAASETLLSIGIRGIKYLDGFSRDRGVGSYNYVVFDDKDIRILKHVYASVVAATYDPKDIVSFDIPLLIRTLEVVREDVKSDTELHNLVESLVNAAKGQDEPLSMQNYDSIFKQGET